MNISTLQMLALMAAGVAIIGGMTVATTSRTRLVKVGGYIFNAVLLVIVAAAVFLAPSDGADNALGRNVAGGLLLAAAGWAALSATRAFGRK